MDYTGGRYSALFLPGEIKKRVIVPSIDDLKPESEECYKAIISVSPAAKLCGARVSKVAEQRVCLFDNDAVTVRFDPVHYSVNETNGGVKLFLKTSNAAVNDFLIQILCSNGTSTG